MPPQSTVRKLLNGRLVSLEHLRSHSILMGFDCSFQVSRNVCIRTVGSTLVEVDQFLLIGIGIRNKKKTFGLLTMISGILRSKLDTMYGVSRILTSEGWRR